MKLLHAMAAVALLGSPAQASPLSTCGEFLTLEQFHRDQIRVIPSSGQLLYDLKASTPQIARYMAVFGWMQGQIEANAWSANGQSLLAGLRSATMATDSDAAVKEAAIEDTGIKMEGTTYDHMTWAFAYCHAYPAARMPVVVNAVFNFFAKR